MKVEHCCTPHELQGLLDGTNVARHSQELESHLESCVDCREGLARLAAGSEWWEEAAAHLSSGDLVAGSRQNHDLMPTKRNASPLDNSNKSHAIHAHLRPAAHPEMMGRLGRFDIDSCIGHGGFGVVYKGHDPELNRAVAIKVLAPHLAASGVARKRFAREAQAAAAINHPNVVAIHAIESEGDFPYLVMTYVPGQSLQTYVQKNGPLPTKSIVRIAQQVAAGLDAAHRQGLVHRDIKPANILLENGLNRAMITDFGLARAADDAAITQTGWLAGTPHYMSPEQAEGKTVDERSDLFSLGSAIFFMATGREPFRGEQPLAVLRKIIQDQPIPADQVNTEVPRTLSRLIDRLLEKVPDHRLQSAEQVSRMLEQYLAHLHQPRVHEQPRLGVSWRVRKLQAAWSLAILACAIGIGALGYGWNVLQTTGDPNFGKATDSGELISLNNFAARAELNELQDLPAQLNELQSLFTRIEAPAAMSNFEHSGSLNDSFQMELIRLSKQIEQLELQLQSVEIENPPSKPSPNSKD
jgi:serine/threonine-protein kinase